jgi:hypothetical protein
MIRQRSYRLAGKSPFIIFVDAIFTNPFERAFTKLFEPISRIAAIACLYRASNAD